MPSDHDDNLLHQAIINIKAGDLSLARRYLELALEMADDRETRTQANYWMSQISSDPLEKRRYLEETIANDPVHPEARRALAVLDGKLKAGEIVNPDALPAQVTESQPGTTERFTCPKCGGRMVFDGDGRTLICEYCSRNQVLSSAAPQFEQDFITTMATSRGHRAPVILKTFNCQGCGAHFILPAQQISTVCAYCGSAHVVVMTRELVEPDSIIPMAFNQRQAAELMLKWLQKHGLQPGIGLAEPRGVYLPVWTFDMFGFIPWTGMVYRNKQQVQVSGEQNVSFNDILIPGVGRLPALFPRMLADFDTSNAPAYDPRYLAGWPAEVYELAMSDASLEARKQAVERMRAKIQAEKGHVNDLQYSSANLSILSFKLVLVPLWNGTYVSDGREFRVLMNGQTGKVYAETHKQGILSWLEDFFGE
jgi:hypothetical protein